MDFKERLQQELQKGKEFSGEGSSLPQRKNPVVRVNSKTSFMGRVLPLEEGKWFATLYESVFIQFVNSKGNITSINAHIDTKDPDDELAQLTQEARKLNLDYKKTHPEEQYPIQFTLSEKGMQYGINIQRRAEFLGIPVINTPQGGKAMALSQTQQGFPQIVNVDVSQAAYYTLLNLLTEGYMINGKPFPTESSFITQGQTFPIGIKLSSQGKSYDVIARPDLVLPSIESVPYLQKDDKGDYLYIDDPVVYHKPLKEEAPSLYAKLVAIVKERIEDGKKIIGTSIPTSTENTTAPTFSGSQEASFAPQDTFTNSQEQPAVDNTGFQSFTPEVTKEAPSAAGNTFNPMDTTSGKPSSEVIDQTFEGIEDEPDVFSDTNFTANQSMENWLNQNK